VIAIALFAGGCATPQGDTQADRRSYILDMKKKALADLTERKPKAEEHLRDAVGYAVFSNISIKIFFLGGANGYGVAVDKKSGKQTFMRMAEVGAGLGLGAKDIRTIFVFNKREAFDQFVEKGWSFGAEASASAKRDDEGASAEGEVKLEEGIVVYQLTQTGLMVDVMISGSKYWKDNDLAQ